MDVNELTIPEMTRRLAQIPAAEPYNHFPVEMLDGPIRPAAVLIPLLRHADAWHVLYIRRTEMDGDRHSGQVAFPGGARDPEDASDEQAALREAHEELGLQPQDVQVIGHLTPHITISNYIVAPIVGAIPWPYPLVPSPDEVGRAFTIPLAWLLDANNRETLKRELPGFGEVSVIYYEKYDQEMLWGATARFTLDLLEALQLM